jgi:hypothetical protein
MNQRNSGHLAIHRRADEVTFLKQRLRDLEEMLQDEQPQGGQRATWQRERDLADELLHTRHTEPLGETLQRRLAMVELVCRDLAPIPHKDAASHAAPPALTRARQRNYGMAETERQALTEMLQHWWAWLRRL